MKRCPKCKKKGESYKDKARHDGLDSWCKGCISNFHSNYYKSNPLKQKEKKAKFVAKNPSYARAYGLRTKYGLTEGQFQDILRYQKNRCAVCKTKNPGGRFKVWQVDHCHEGGFVRGLLCFNCNKHLGFYERISEGIIAYLDNPPAIDALRGNN